MDSSSSFVEQSESDDNVSEMEASYQPSDDSVSSVLDCEKDRSRSFLATGISVEDKKLKPKPFAWHLKERLHGYTSHRGSEQEASKTNSSDSHMSTSTPDKRRSSPFVSGAMLSPIPRMGKLSTPSAPDDVLTEEMNKSMKNMSMSDVFDAYSEDGSLAAERGNAHAESAMVVNDSLLSAGNDKEASMASEGESLDLVTSPGKSEHFSEDVSLVSVDSYREVNPSKSFSSTSSDFELTRKKTPNRNRIESNSSESENESDVNKTPEIEADITSLSFVDEDKNRTTNVDYDISSVDFSADSPADVEEIPSPYEEDDSVIVINDSSDEEREKKTNNEEGRRMSEKEKDTANEEDSMRSRESMQEKGSSNRLTNSSNHSSRSNSPQVHEVITLNDSLADGMESKGDMGPEMNTNERESDEETDGRNSAALKENDSPITQKFREGLRGMDIKDLQQRLQTLIKLKRNTNLSGLPDGGTRLCRNARIVKETIMERAEENNRESGEGTRPLTTGGRDWAIGSPAVHVLKQEEPKRGPLYAPPKPLNPEEYSRLISNRPAPKLFGGKMTDDRIHVAKKITGDVIQQMHSSLSTAPEYEETPSPEGLRTQLMHHQRCGLTWLLWRETQSPPGGILADDMGLGKTLSLISLIVHSKNERKKKALCNDELIPSCATLVITPASIIYQWKSEIEHHVEKDRLNVLVFHGPKPKREGDPKILAEYDVVITTYNLVASELSEKVPTLGESDTESDSRRIAKRRIAEGNVSVLTKVAWDRIVLDEAHRIKNKASLTSKACCRLPAASRWCLTATPIHNTLGDLFSLIRFLRVTPFDEEAVCKELIMGSSQTAANILNTLVKGLLLRRTKEQTCPATQKPIVDLKPRKYEKVELNLEGLEAKVYEMMFTASLQKVKELLKGQEKGDLPAMRDPYLDNSQVKSTVITQLLRLRQACVHMALIKKAVDMEAFETLGADEESVSTAGDELANHLANMSIMEDDQIAADLVKEGHKGNVEKLFTAEYLSAKLRALFERLDHALESGDKCVIVSQWTSLLDIVKLHLNVEYTSITGKVLTKDRQPRVDSFNQVGRGARVMLLSLKAGGPGLNLVGGNHLFMVDLHWNPALEQQACDRIYRMGQKKNVFIHKLICRGTIEERVLELQTKKTDLAKDVLEGAASKKLSKLTMAHLKYLFGLGKLTNEPPSVSNVP